MTAFEGMDTGAVRRIASQLNGQADAVAGIITAINGLVNHATGVWQGADAHDFAGWWSSQHRPQLQAAHDALRGLGQSAVNNADAQDRVSGGNASLSSGAIGGAGAALGAGAAAAAATAASSGQNGSQDYSAARSIQIARSELNTKQGECTIAVQHWVNAAGGKFGYGAPDTIYNNSGAVQITDMSQVRPGDVLQRISTTDPGSWDASGLHTALVAGVNSQTGTLDVIESNVQGTGVVTENPNWTPQTLPNTEWQIWRFAKNP